jgi:hypothetical protein
MRTNRGLATPAGEDQVAVEPPAARLGDDEAHPRVQGDACSLRQRGHRPEARHDVDDALEGRPNLGF